MLLGSDKRKPPAGSPRPDREQEGHWSCRRTRSSTTPTAWLRRSGDTFDVTDDDTVAQWLGAGAVDEGGAGPQADMT